MTSIPLELLRGLTGQQRRVVLYEDAGLTYAQISGRMGRSVCWVGVMLNHARRHIAARQGDIERKARALEQVEYLPKSLRETARLRLSGWSCLEAAKRQGISRVTAAQQWHRAQALLYNLEGAETSAVVAGQERSVVRPVSAPEELSLTFTQQTKMLMFADGEEVRPI